MKKKVIVAALISVAAALLLTVSYIVYAFIYNNHYRLTAVGQAISPDGRYTVSVYMVGQPAFFDDTTVRVTVKNEEDGRLLKTFDASVGNDGGVISQSNWDVVWQSDAVEVTLKGDEQPDVRYCVPLE